MKLVLYVLPILPPLLCGFFIVISPGKILVSYLLYLALLFSWWQFLAYVFKLDFGTHPLSPREETDYRNSLWILIPSIALVLTLLALFRRTVEREVFLTVILTLFFMGIAMRLLPKRPLSFRLPSLYLSLTLTTAIAYYLLLRKASWPILPLSLSAATLPLIPWLGNQLLEWSSSLPQTVQNRQQKRKAYKVQRENPIQVLSRIHSVSLGVFPAVLFLMCVTSLLPSHYLLACLPILLAPRLLNETRGLETSHTLSRRFLVQNTLYPFAFPAILLALFFY